METGTECTRLGLTQHTAKDAWDETVQRGRKAGRPPQRFGRQLARSLVSLLALRVCLSGGLPHFFAFRFTTVTQSNLKGPGSSHSSSEGPMARWSPSLYSLYRTLLQVLGKDPALEREEGEGSPRLTCGLRSPFLGFLHSPTPAPGLQVSQARQLDRDSNVQSSGNPSDLPPQEPQLHTYLDLQNHTPQHHTSTPELLPKLARPQVFSSLAAAGQSRPSATSQ